MLKELFMALEMAKAARNLQQQMGNVNTVYMDVNKKEDKLSMVINCDYHTEYIDLKNTEEEDLLVVDDAVTVWNYCVDRSSFNWKTCYDDDERAYKIGSFQVNGVWFTVTEW